MARITLPSAPYEPDVAASLAKWMPPGLPGDPPLIFRLFQVHPELASRARVLGAGLLGHGRLPARDRELAIDRVTGRHGAAHEWGLHAAFFSPQVDLDGVQLDSTATGPRQAADAWTDAELALLDAIDELDETTDLSDETWRMLRDRYDDQQMIELIMVVGWYRTIASMCNAVRLEQDPAGRPFPSADGSPT